MPCALFLQGGTGKLKISDLLSVRGCRIDTVFYTTMELESCSSTAVEELVKSHRRQWLASFLNAGDFSTRHSTVNSLSTCFSPPILESSNYY